ncbi:Uncharacterised protein [Mycobacteroides abscessus subsp. massiliense]|nr:Uncharacterised protein [Mycobacteroides abscessus subsp. abscessus]SKM68989.1 Uncharacterised protein [Mycobacteroides abscessus subsp. massiliense]SKN34861.1 Uncharacterised protein [Mycobacteroides abscessus subsp. massiliense]SKP16757.1 Uncharacterised protein [Mycobacteroides abscessus subsp. massiliense]SKP56679.1 Uncharacterised protein [Mycobacteroides abscessus subsp. massiliense]
MSGPTRSMILGIDKNSYRPLLDAVHAMATKYEQRVSTFKGYVDKPGGTAWEGQTAEAGQHNVNDGWKVTARIQDIDTKFQTVAGLAVDHTIVPELGNCQTMIENIEAQRNKGLTLTEDLEVGYDPPPGVSEKQAAENAKVAEARGKELKESARKWWEAEQEVKRLAEGAARDMENEVNSAAGTFDIGKAVKDTAPGKPDTAQDSNYYKELYPKKTAPASVDPGAGTLGDKLEHINNPGLTKPVAAPVDPNAPVYGPPSVQKLDPNSPEGKAAIDKMRVILSPGRTPAEVEDIINRAKNYDPNKQLPPPKAPEGNPTPHRQSGGEAFAESWDQAGRAKDDLLGINGGDHAKEAWKGVAKGLWDVVNPDPVHQVERGIDQAKGAIDEVKSGIDNPKAFIGKHGIEIAAGIATAPLGGEGALLGTEGRALTHGLEDAAPGHPPTPHSVESPSSATHTPISDHPAPASADHSQPPDHPKGPFPLHGEPGSYGYDADGNRLPYANGGRPGYAADQEATTFDITRQEQLADIANGVTKLPPPGPSEVWVRLMDDAEGPGVRVTETGERYGLVQWEPGMPRKEVWDMGHVPGSEYRYLKELYMSGQITHDQFMAEVKNPNNYRVEDWLRNRSHVDEGP